MPDNRTALIQAMEAHFGSDGRRIRHARKVTEYAEMLLAREGGEPTVVIAAALLHDIGIHAAQAKYGSTAGKYQEIEGPPIARRILQGLNLPPEHINEICEIIAHHHSPGRVNTANFRIVYDADWLVNLKDEYGTNDKTALEKVIDRLFLTETGRAMAKRIYLHPK